MMGKDMIGILLSEGIAAFRRNHNIPDEVTDLDILCNPIDKYVKKEVDE